MEVTTIIALTSLCLVLLVLVIGVLFIYFRPKFPVRVNCWFCGEDTVVPYGNKNCWDCPSCDQYNGFGKDGDYNKPIPAQYSENLNFPFGCQARESISKDDTLCDKCNQNQLLKVRQLAAFVPLNEANYDREVEMFQTHLDRLYALCEDCQVAVNTEIGKQDYLLKKKLQHLNVDHERGISSTLDNTNTDMKVRPQTGWCRTSMLVRLLDFCSFTCGSLLGLQELHRHYPDIIPPYLLLWITSPSMPVLAVTGILLSVMTKVLLGKHRLVRLDALNVPVWGTIALTGTHQAQGLLTERKMEWVIPMCHTVNVLLCAVCVLVKRSSRSKVVHNMRRCSLDTLDTSNHSDTSQSSTIPSASENCYKMSAPSVPNYVDDTLSELCAFSLGTAGQRLKRSDSGIFTQTSFISGNPVSTAGFNFKRALHEQRPLISPAKFNARSFSSTDNIFLSANKEQDNHHNGGLFKTQRCDWLNQKSSSAQSNVSGFGRSSVFGETPFNLSAESGSSIPVMIGETTIKPQDSGSSVYSDNFSTCERSWGLRNHPIRSISEDTDSIASRSSLACPVDSTTVIEKKDQFWKSSGFLGFIMGASVVANLALAYGYLQKT